jgi:hypothetical protein
MKRIVAVFAIVIGMAVAGATAEAGWYRAYARGYYAGAYGAPVYVPAPVVVARPVYSYYRAPAFYAAPAYYPAPVYYGPPAYYGGYPAVGVGVGFY